MYACQEDRVDLKGELTFAIMRNKGFEQRKEKTNFREDADRLS